MAKSESALPKSWQPKKYPKKLGDCIDLVFKAHQKRMAMQRDLEALEQEERQAKEFIIQTFQKQEIEGARGKLGSISIREKDVPKVTDWDKFYSHIQRTGDFDLLQRRPGEAACQARWEDGKEIPGVEKFHKLDVTLNEVK